MPIRLPIKPINLIFLATILVLPVAAPPVSVAHAQFTSPQGEFTPGPCTYDIPAGLQAGVDIECGTLTVPEDHANPDGGKIELGVAIFRSQAENPAPDPLFFAQGGPGGSTIATFGLLLGLNNPFASSRDVVLWDQRGTMYADPELRCEEFIAATVETLDQVLSDEEEARITIDAIDRCRERYSLQQVDPSLYNSRQNAADAEALRTALGYDQINYYGVSYGSLLGFYLMDAYPQGLRSVILDAVVLPQENFLLTAGQNMSRSFDRLFAACQASETCQASYPDLESTFYALVDRLNETPAEITIANPQTQNIYPALLDGDLFLTAIFQLLYPTEYIAFLPKIITDAANGDYDFLANAILPLLLFDDTISDGMYFSVICAENMDYTADDFRLDGLRPQISQAEARDLTLIKEMCEVWNVDSLQNSLETSVSSDLPVLLLSGGFDPITPPQNAELAAEALTSDQQVVFPAGGHGQLLSGECQNDIVLAFLDDPGAPLDTSCIPPDVDFVSRGDILPLPLTGNLFGSDITALFSDLFWLSLVLLALFAMAIALIVYPLRWLYRRTKSSPAGSLDGEAGEDKSSRGQLFIRMSPWLILLAAVFLVIFLSLVTSTIVSLVLDNNPIIFYGFPRATWPLFLLPFILLALGLLIAVGAVLRWLHSHGSLLDRILFSLLTLALFLGLLGLFQLGMFTAFFQA